jgi:hypothetical protein
MVARSDIVMDVRSLVELQVEQTVQYSYRIKSSGATSIVSRDTIYVAIPVCILRYGKALHC